MLVMPGEYAAAFAAPLVLAWVLTPLMLRLANRLGVLDHPDDERKAHTSPVPYLGGVAIVLAFVAVIVTAAAVYRPYRVYGDLVVVLAVGAGLALVGLLDDLRGLSPFLRLAVEVAAGVAVWGVGSGVSLPGPTWSDVVITVLWVVGITNAFNLLDNMDGLSAGVAAIASISFFTIALMHGQYLVAALAVAVAGCALGFLRHNFHPAKIYMGDAGSLFLGYLLAVIGIRLRLPDQSHAVALFVPILVLGVALFDTTLVTLNRLRHGVSPLVGGRDHASHRLVWIGIPVPVAVGLVYAVSASLGWLAVILSRVDTATGMMLVGFVMLVGLGLMLLLSAVPVYDNSRQRRHMVRVVREHEPEPEPPAGAGDTVQPGQSQSPVASWP